MPITDITEQLVNGADWLYNASKDNRFFQNFDGTRFYTVSATDPDYLKLKTKQPIEGIGADSYLPFTEIPYSYIRKGLPKRDYIGGDKTAVRIEGVKRIPGLTKEISRIGKLYNVDPNLILHRLMKEGYIDLQVSDYNKLSPADQTYHWENLWNKSVQSWWLGAHSASDLLADKKMQIKDPNASWESVGGNIYAKNLNSALNVLAADLAYRQEELRKRGIANSDLNMYTNASYNLGLNNKNLNNKNYVIRNYSVPNYYNIYGFKSGGILKGQTGIKPQKDNTNVIQNWISKKLDNSDYLNPGFRKWYND